ncbi:MAG: PrsW family intramembrane metalloprotease [Anaerolineales bacterium]|nr:PrsW family intramembrane metalloprotease [Anaerolineales bacterium]
MTQSKSTPWGAISVFTLIAFGLVVFAAIAFIMGTISVIDLLGEKSQPVVGMIVAFSAGAEFLILLICAWFILQKIMGKETAEQNLQFAPPAWLASTLIALICIALIFGAIGIIAKNIYLTWVILPAATLFVIIPPLLLFISIGARKLELGAQWRVWGTLGLGLTLSPALMIFLEMLILGLIWLGLALLSSLQPGKLQELQHLGKLLLDETNESALFFALRNYLTNPRVLIGVFGYLSLLVPMIEELFKPLAVWLFARKIETPAQGFTLGLLSGGAFALIESLNASAEASETWLVVGIVRAGASLLHILLTGLMGYAIVGAFKEKKIWRLLLTYGAVVAIHGLWNACALSASLFESGELLGKPEWLFFLPASISGIIALSLGMFILLFIANRKFRSQTQLTIVEPLKDTE